MKVVTHCQSIDHVSRLVERHVLSPRDAFIGTRQSCHQNISWVGWEHGGETIIIGTVVGPSTTTVGQPIARIVRVVVVGGVWAGIAAACVTIVIVVHNLVPLPVRCTTRSSPLLVLAVLDLQNNQVTIRTKK